MIVVILLLSTLLLEGHKGGRIQEILRSFIMITICK